MRIRNQLWRRWWCLRVGDQLRGRKGLAAQVTRARETSSEEERATVYPKLSDRLQRFSAEGRILYLEPEYPDWITINVRYKGIFDLFDGRHSVGDITRFIEQSHQKESALLNEQVGSLIQNSRIFEHNKAAIPQTFEAYNAKPKYVYLTLTDDCNLNCRYCFAKARSRVDSLDVEGWCAFVDELLAFSNPIIFTFTGGEPLLIPYLFDLATYINKKSSSCILLTNGTNIDSKDNAKRIAECFELVKVSLDSHRPETCSELRGRGTLDKVEAAIELLDEAEVNYTVVATVCRLNKGEVDEFAQHFNNRVSFQPLYRMGSAERDSELFISGDEYYEALTRTGLFKYLSNYHRNIHGYRGNPSKRCAMATEELSVGPNGDLYPCHMLHYPELKVGNVNSGESIEDVYRKSEVLGGLRKLSVDTIPQCTDCCVRNFCAGGCRARLDFYGDGLKGDDSFCSFEKKLILDALLHSYG